MKCVVRVRVLISVSIMVENGTKNITISGYKVIYRIEVDA